MMTKKRKQKRIQNVLLALFLLFFSFFAFPPDELSAVETNLNQSSETLTVETKNETSQDTLAPFLSIESPISDETFNSSTVAISGVVSDDYTSSEKISLSIYEDPDNIVSLSADSNGIWLTSMKLSEGEHTVYVKATDESGNSITDSVSFSVIITSSKSLAENTVQSITEVQAFNTVSVREIKAVNEVNITNDDNIVRDLLLTANSTKVKLDTAITMKVSDITGGITYTGKITGNPITLFKKVENDNKLELVPGTTVYDAATRQFVLTPTPKSQTEPALTTNTTYYVYINRAWMDTNIIAPEEIGFDFYPKFLKFTTTSESNDNIPHGNFEANTNLCKNCHNSHASTSIHLEKPGYFDPETIDIKADEFCMACHDGTVAPRPENIDDTHKHDKMAGVDSNMNTSGSCTSCHNPHSSWSGDNPSILHKNHYVYKHNDGDEGVSTTEAIDSLDNSCDSCHDDAADVKESSKTESFKTLHYRKTPTASGTIDDSSLCFRCHNGSKTDVDGNIISDIKSLYDESSMHVITSADGSGFTGRIPCAECHDSHGSNNIHLLKDKLGHENQQSFSATTGNWDPAKEKDFCIKCHNGATAIYGVTAKLFDETDINHSSITTETCKDCHGGESKSFMEAAHSPKMKGTTP